MIGSKDPIDFVFRRDNASRIWKTVLQNLPNNLKSEKSTDSNVGKGQNFEITESADKTSTRAPEEIGRREEEEGDTRHPSQFHDCFRIVYRTPRYRIPRSRHKIIQPFQFYKSLPSFSLFRLRLADERRIENDRNPLARRNRSNRVDFRHLFSVISFPIRESAIARVSDFYGTHRARCLNGLHGPISGVRRDEKNAEVRWNASRKRRQG